MVGGDVGVDVAANMGAVIESEPGAVAIRVTPLLPRR